jgi:hypothetical protein
MAKEIEIRMMRWRQIVSARNNAQNTSYLFHKIHLEINMVPYLEFIQSGRVNFQDVPGWLSGDVCQTPGVRQDRIDNHLPGVDPDDAKVDENEQHVDGSAKPAIVCLNQQQTLFQS